MINFKSFLTQWALVFVVLAPLNAGATYLWYNPTYCGYIHEWYARPAGGPLPWSIVLNATKREELRNPPVQTEDSDEEFALPVARCRESASIRYRAIGFPAAVIVEKLASTSEWTPAVLFYPAYLVINIAWLLVLSAGLAAFSRRMLTKR